MAVYLLPVAVAAASDLTIALSLFLQCVDCVEKEDPKSSFFSSGSTQLTPDQFSSGQSILFGQVDQSATRL